MKNKYLSSTCLDQLHYICPQMTPSLLEMIKIKKCVQEGALSRTKRCRSSRIIIPVGVRLMPLPCGLDDRIQVGISGMPVQLPAGLLMRPHKHGRISRTPGTHRCRNIFSGYPPGRLKDLLDRIAGSANSTMCATAPSSFLTFFLNSSRVPFHSL